MSGTLIQRYKRFLADIRLDSGEEIVAHCANPGAMLGLSATGARVWLTRSDNPARKLAYSWLYVETDFGTGAPQMVGIDTSLPNRLVAEALQAGAIAELRGYDQFRPEVKYGANSRIDFLLSGPGQAACYLEIKNVHFMRTAGLAEFPDSSTARGAKHLAEMSAMVAQGHRAMMLYVIQMQAERLTFARDMDAAYGAAFDLARKAGVEAIAYVCAINAERIVLERAVPVLARL
ncbi:MAG: DNA/RNA nuclease SfsA [Beijerinckiaceae bacterium]